MVERSPYPVIAHGCTFLAQTAHRYMNGDRVLSDFAVVLYDQVHRKKVSRVVRVAEMRAGRAGRKVGNHHCSEAEGAADDSARRMKESMLERVTSSAGESADNGLGRKDSGIQPGFESRYVDWGPIHSTIPLSANCSSGFAARRNL